ncbi:MAG: phosphatidylglycerophosphatase A [Dissulfurispiraceae bacterium]
MDAILRSCSKVIATVFFVGFIPFAPGTCGTFASMIFIWAAKPSFTWQFIILISTLIVGTKTADVAEKVFDQKDCRHIVVDEFVGYLCSIIFLPLTPTYMVAAFLLFRFFDILKPPPIRMIEKLGGGVGIMFDDVAAGITTNVLLHLIRLF